MTVDLSNETEFVQQMMLYMERHSMHDALSALCRSLTSPPPMTSTTSDPHPPYHPLKDEEAITTATKPSANTNHHHDCPPPPPRIHNQVEGRKDGTTVPPQPSSTLSASPPQLSNKSRRSTVTEAVLTNNNNSATTPNAKTPTPTASSTPTVIPIQKKLCIVTIPGNSAELWEIEQSSYTLAPVFPNGVGFSYDMYQSLFQPQQPQQPSPPSTNFQRSPTTASFASNSNNIKGTTIKSPTNKQQIHSSVVESIEFIKCKPFLKEATKSSHPLESFDLRVIYEAGRTGFEADKEFPIIVNSVIAGRYQVLQYLDSAAFSRAVRCLDLKHGHEVCIKIIRNSKDFFDQSLDEIKLLQHINSSGNPEENGVLQLYDYFYYKEHIFIVCELLKDNLYEFSKFSREHEADYYFTVPRVQCITKQVLKALAFVHSQKLMHCDLKPENILLKSCSRCEVKVIDFGSSCFDTDNLSSYVQSRCYRAPEVVLGCHYDGRIDIWSLGAILPELITGHVLFHNDSVSGMLARIAGMCGVFPERLVHEGRHSCRYITKTGCFYEVSKDNGEVNFHFPLVPCSLSSPGCGAQWLGTEDPLFKNFVLRCLTVDFVKRPTAAELLLDPFILKDYGNVYSAPPATSQDGKK